MEGIFNWGKGSIANLGVKFFKQDICTAKTLSVMNYLGEGISDTSQKISISKPPILEAVIPENLAQKTNNEWLAMLYPENDVLEENFYPKLSDIPTLFISPPLVIRRQSLEFVENIQTNPEDPVNTKALPEKTQASPESSKWPNKNYFLAAAGVATVSVLSYVYSESLSRISQAAFNVIIQNPYTTGVVSLVSAGALAYGLLKDRLVTKKTFINVDFRSERRSYDPLSKCGAEIDLSEVPEGEKAQFIKEKVLSETHYIEELFKDVAKVYPIEVSQPTMLAMQAILLSNQESFISSLNKLLNSYSFEEDNAEDFFKRSFISESLVFQNNSIFNFELLIRLALASEFPEGSDQRANALDLKAKLSTTSLNRACELFNFSLDLYVKRQDGNGFDHCLLNKNGQFKLKPLIVGENGTHLLCEKVEK